MSSWRGEYKYVLRCSALLLARAVARFSLVAQPLQNLDRFELCSLFLVLVAVGIFVEV